MLRSFFLALVALSLSACASAQPPAQTPQRSLSAPYPQDAAVTRADGYLYEAERIDERVWLLSSPEPFHVQPYGNVTIIQQSDGFVLIDAGGTPAAADRIAAFLRQIDSTLPVKAIVITHWHGDHNTGLRRLMEIWPRARTISTRPTQESLSSPRTAAFMFTGEAAHDTALMENLRGGLGYLRGRSEDASLAPELRARYGQAFREITQHIQEMQGAARIAPTETFDESLTIADANAPVDIMFLGRANTDGDAVVWLPRQRILASGDTIVAPVPFGFGSFPGEWIAVLQRIRAMDFATLIPGHGRPMRDRIYIDRLIALLTEVRAQVQPLAAQGLSLEEVRRRVDLSAQARIFAGEDTWLSRFFAAYWVEPITASAYREARGEPIVQGAE